MEKRFHDEREAMPAEERQRYFEGRLRETVSYAYKNAPAMKKKFDQAGVEPSTIRSIKDLEKLPITRKGDLLRLEKENPPFGGLLGVPKEAIKMTLVHPGPFYFPLLFEEERIKSAAAELYAMGIRKGNVVLITFTATFGFARALEEAVAQLGALPVPAGPGSTDVQIETMRQMGINSYIGSISFLINIIKRAEEQGFNFRRDFKLREVISAAEVLPLSERIRLERDYSLSIADFYGAIEAGTVGYNCSEKSGFHTPLDKVIEIVDTETGKQLGPGETGEVVVTTFSKALPLIRFGLSDLSYYLEELCPCGRTSGRLAGVIGRIGEIAKVRGVLILPHQVERTISAFAVVSAFQAEVSRPAQRDHIAFKIELKDDTVNREELAESLKEEFMKVSRVRLDRVEFVPQGTIPPERKTIVDVRKWD